MNVRFAHIHKIAFSKKGAEGGDNKGGGGSRKEGFFIIAKFNLNNNIYLKINLLIIFQLIKESFFIIESEYNQYFKYNLIHII